jgi:phosphatidylserine decarboxylase
VYWLDPNRKTNVKIGDRFGMMKFGSRLDMYLPADDVAVVAVLGTAVRAGETVVAIARGGGES